MPPEVDLREDEVVLQQQEPMSNVVFEQDMPELASSMPAPEAELPPPPAPRIHRRPPRIDRGLRHLANPGKMRQTSVVEPDLTSQVRQMRMMEQDFQSRAAPEPQYEAPDEPGMEFPGAEEEGYPEEEEFDMGDMEDAWQDPEEIAQQHRERMRKLLSDHDTLVRAGFKPTKVFDRNSDPEELEDWVERTKRVEDTETSVKLYRHIFVGAMGLIELSNKKLDPFGLKLDNLSANVAANQKQYDHALLRLYQQYRESIGEMNPIVELGLITLMTVVTTHMANAAADDAIEQEKKQKNMEMENRRFGPPATFNPNDPRIAALIKEEAARMVATEQLNMHVPQYEREPAPPPAAAPAPSVRRKLQPLLAQQQPGTIQIDIAPPARGARKKKANTNVVREAEIPVLADVPPAHGGFTKGKRIRVKPAPVEVPTEVVKPSSPPAE